MADPRLIPARPPRSEATHDLAPPQSPRCQPSKSRGVAYGRVTVVIAALGLVLAGGALFLRARHDVRVKSMMPHHLAAAFYQLILEQPDRIFVYYEDLVGLGRYIGKYTPIDGEDLSIQFPIRRDWLNPITVQLPDGTEVTRLEVLAAIGKSGAVVPYPFPQGDAFDRKRVYRLDCGVSFQDFHVVDKRPDPAGREGRDQDGVHIVRFPDGRRFEITYRNGVPDGPFYAFHANGRLWGAATYRNGRVVDRP